MSTVSSYKLALNDLALLSRADLLAPWYWHT